MNTIFIVSGFTFIIGACLASLYWLFNKQHAIEDLTSDYDHYVELYQEGLDIQEKKAELFQELSNNLAKENKLLKDELAKKYGQNTTN